MGVDSELEMLRADGSRFFARLDSAAHSAGQPGYMQCLTVLSDISEQKRAAAMVQEARETSEQASDAKTRFLAAASHDIRQPLQALTTVCDLLRRRLREPKNLELLDCQTEALAGMRELLDALLDVSRLDSGTIAPEIRSFPVAPLLRRLETHYQPLARNKGLTLRVARCSAVIESDPVLLRQILDNLVANAIRYTAKGRVLVGCRRRGGALRFEVWDTGIGIAEDEQARIFEDFYQLGNPARDANNGLGLGLAIVERTARLLGHRIGLKSRDKGTLFTVAAPLAEPGSGTNENPPAEKPVPTHLPTAATVLLVEDNDAVRDSMVMMLNSYGYRVIAARDGAEALHRISGEAPRPNIIVTDYRLPEGETGPQAIAAVRNALGADLPALILTGDIELAHSPEALGISCTILQKPINPATLNKHMQRLLS
jgi:two-component system CheB/CheR fusion protein